MKIIIHRMTFFFFIEEKKKEFVKIDYQEVQEKNIFFLDNNQ